jgi:2'-5' RNA ligase
MIKNFFQFMNSLVTEKKGDAYEHGCSMIYFDFPDAQKLHDMIDPDDIYTEEGDRSFGLEDEPHATLLFGLHSDEIPDEEVLSISTSVPVGELTLKNASLFKNANKPYEVLKFDVDNAALYSINKKLAQLPHTTEFPDYHPHCTVAYLKKGTGDKYVEKLKDLEFTVHPDKIVYSKPDGSKLYSTWS